MCILAVSDNLGLMFLTTWLTEESYINVKMLLDIEPLPTMYNKRTRRLYVYSYLIRVNGFNGCDDVNT